MKIKTIKIHWVDYQKLRKIFPAEHKEYVWHYFYRLRKFLEEPRNVIVPLD